MFGEKFFSQLDETVKRYVAASDEVDDVTVLVRTRLGSFNVARVHADEMLVRLRVYPPPQEEAVADGESSASDTRPAEGHEPATNLDTLPLAYVPYAEIVIVELMPRIGDRGYIPDVEAAKDPVIGFGR